MDKQIQFLVKISFLIFIGSHSLADDDCQNWFSELKINRAQNNCLEQCMTAETDMGTFTCHDKCENLCQIRRSEIPNNCKIPQTELKCDFYDRCLENIFNCGDEGYPKSYGKKYCERFLSLKISEHLSDYGLSSKGIKWRDETLLCLQNVLAYDFARRDYPLTCDSIKKEAFDSHVDCYTKFGSTSLCSLPAVDIAVVLYAPDKLDLTNSMAIKQILHTGANCFVEWFLDDRQFLNISKISYSDLNLESSGQYSSFKPIFLQIKKSITLSNLESKTELLNLNDQLNDTYNQILVTAASDKPYKKQYIKQLIFEFKSIAGYMNELINEGTNE